MKQTVKLDGNTGSLVNYLLGNNSTLPAVGIGATMLHYSDRSPYEVVSVSGDGKTVVLEACDAKRIDKNGMGDAQEYEYTLNGRQTTIVWRNGAWRRQCQEVYFTDEALTMTYEERAEKCLDPDTKQAKVIPGLTYLKKSFPKISIVFGKKEKYHDFSF